MLFANVSAISLHSTFHERIGRELLCILLKQFISDRSFVGNNVSDTRTSIPTRNLITLENCLNYTHTHTDESTESARLRNRIDTKRCFFCAVSQSLCSSVPFSFRKTTNKRARVARKKIHVKKNKKHSRLKCEAKQKKMLNKIHAYYL